MPKKSKNNQSKTTTVHVAVPDEVLQRVRQKAKTERRTTHAHLSLLIELASAIDERILALHAHKEQDTL
jgi:predicted PilT family ATPase